MSLHSSRIPGFYKFSVVDRAAFVAQWAGLSPQEQSVFFGLTGLSVRDADNMIENVIGVYGLPMGVATNFQINGRDVLVPMVTEEPSVVAAVSNAAKAIREGGGFTASSTDPVMIGQIQILDIKDVWEAARKIHAEEAALLKAANDPTFTIVKMGGGAREIETRPFEETPVGAMLIVHLLIDVRDAMGANIVNSMCERVAPLLEEITGGRANLRILSNLADQRTATASCRIPAEALTTEAYSGDDVVDRILEAAAFAEVDPYRATTHNKGTLNGIDAVALATGNDWRAIEAGAHAYASRNGRYTSMTQWWKTPNGDLEGSLTLPMAVGIVGGATKSHPTARVALKMLKISKATELGEIMVCVGLAQNFAAMRALATEGIQRGHMSLHARQIAMAAGAQGDMLHEVVRIMLEENNIRLERAKELVQQLSK
jgi:hydroxymethylglutaryl-CoA reductase